MNDAQSTTVGLKAQECPAGGWNGMPAELEGKATVADCLADGSCGCIYGDAVKHIERLQAALEDAFCKANPLVSKCETCGELIVYPTKAATIQQEAAASGQGPVQK